MSQTALQPIYIDTETLEFIAGCLCICLSVCICLCLCHCYPRIVCVISFQKIYGLIGWQWACDDLQGCRGDLDL